MRRKKSRGEAKKASDDMAAALAAAIKDVAAKEDILKALVEARAKAKPPWPSCPTTRRWPRRPAQFKTRADEVDAQLAAARKAGQRKNAAGAGRLAASGRGRQAAASRRGRSRAARAALDVADAKVARGAGKVPHGQGPPVAS